MADPNLKVKRPKTKSYMLFSLVMDECSTPNRDTFLKYVSDGADINHCMPEEDLNTPLHLAIIHKDLRWIRFLIENGADQKIKNEDEKTAVELAEASGSPTILSFFLEAMIDTVNNVTSVDFQDATDKLITGEKILIIDKCLKFHDFVEEISKTTVLQHALNETSVFVVAIYLEGKSLIRECDLLQLNQSCPKAMILQVTSESSDDIFYKNQDEHFKKLSIKKYPLKAQYLNCFNFEYICNLMFHNPSKYGIFEWNLTKIKMFNEASTDGLRLIENAITKKDILVLKFLLLFKPSFYTKNGNNQRVLEVAVGQSTLEILKILLGDPKESEDNKILLEARERKALNLISYEGKSLLIIAVEREEFEMIKFLIKCGLKFTSTDSRCKNAFESALKINDYDLAMDILQAGGAYPDNFNIRTLNDGSDLKKCIESVEIFHDAIKNNNKTYSKKFIEQNPHKLKIAYNVKNISAMSTALEVGQFKIYSLLQSKGFSNGADPSHDEILKHFNNRDRAALEKAQRKYFKKPKSVHIIKLLGQSRIGSDNERENFSKIQEFYNDLDDISKIKPILMAVASSKNIEIVFDFNRDSVRGLHPTEGDDVGGLAVNDDNLILIGAKRKNYAEVLGTLAHEITHYAIQMCYKNNYEPFHIDDNDQKMKFNKIVAKYGSKEFKNKNVVIDRAYGYVTEEISSELIVRPAHLMALHKDQPVKLQELRKIFHELFEFYENNFLKDLNEVILFMEDEQNIQEVNKNLGIFSKFDASKLLFSESSVGEFKQILSATENVSISSNLSCLVLSSLIRHMRKTGVKKIDSSHIFADIQHLGEESVHFGRIKEAFASKKEPKMFIICENDATINSEAVREITKNFNKLGRLVLLTKIELSSKDFPTQFEMNFNWRDLDSTSKDKIMNWNLNFQGINISVKEIVARDSDMFSQLSLEEILVLDGMILRTTQELQTGVKKIYIDRKFKYSGHSDNIKKSFSSDEILKMIEVQKTRIVLENIAGMGKSATAKHLAGMLKERNCSKWVEFIDLKQHTSVFLENGDSNQPKPINVTFFSEKLFELKSNLERKLFEHMFITKNVMFVFDGFDEISPRYNIFVLKLLAAIKISENHLLITTRTHCKDKIHKVVSGSVMYIEPFTLDQSIDLLVQLWQEKSTEIEERQHCLDNLKLKSKNLLNYMNKYSGDECVEVPLQIVMLSEFNGWKLDSSSNDDLTYNMFSFYRKFIDKKLNIWIHKGPLAVDDNTILQTSRNVVDIHREAAVTLLLGDKICKTLKFNKMTEDEEHIVVRIGILVYASNGIFEFSHRTFAEYFLADYICSDTSNDLDGKSKMFFEVMKNEWGHNTIRRLINDALVESEKRFKKVLSRNITNNFIDALFVESLTTVIKEKLSKLLKLYLTNNEDRFNRIKNSNDMSDKCNNFSYIFASTFYTSLEIFKDLRKVMTAVQTPEEQKELLTSSYHSIWNTFHNHEVLKNIMNIAVGLLNTEELKIFICRTNRNDWYGGSNFVTIWRIVEKRFDDEDQRQILMKLFKKSHKYYYFNNTVHNLHIGTIKLLIQGILMMRHGAYESLLHYAVAKGNIRRFKTVLSFMEKYLDKGKFKELLLRKANHEIQAAKIFWACERGGVLDIEILKLLDKYFSSEEFFELMAGPTENYQFSLLNLKTHQIAEFKQIWQIFLNKVDNEAQLIKFLKLKNRRDKTYLDLILCTEDEEKLSFLRSIFYQWLEKITS